jgi:glycogen debranching enzyme
VSLTTLVAWNGQQVGIDTGDLVAAIDDRWDAERRVWVDAGAADTTSGRTRTLEALLPLLVLDRPDALASITDPVAFGGDFGPCGVHRGEPAFDRRRYWRGPVWPQLGYLLWLAGARVAETTARGAVRSGFAEFWDPDDATGLGASPQSWTCLAIVLSRRSNVGSPSLGGP